MDWLRAAVPILYNVVCIRVRYIYVTAFVDAKTDLIYEASLVLIIVRARGD